MADDLSTLALAIRDQLSKDGGAIVAARHRSTIDAMVRRGVARIDAGLPYFRDDGEVGWAYLLRPYVAPRKPEPTGDDDRALGILFELLEGGPDDAN